MYFNLFISELLADLYERQEDLDPSTFETRASTILVGLGFKSSATDSEGKNHDCYDMLSNDLCADDYSV